MTRDETIRMFREGLLKERIPDSTIASVVDADECPRCFRRLSRPYLTEQEVRRDLLSRDINVMGELRICPTCHHYVLQRDEGITNKENRMGQRLNPETGEPLTEMVGPNGGPYVEVGKRADGRTHPTGGPFTQESGTGDGMTKPPPEHILQFFAYDHLPHNLQAVSRPFCELARAIVGDPSEWSQTGLALPRNPERTVALRKLLEAKDAAVRAVIAK